MADLLSLLGLAKKAGKLEIGEEPVGAACRARKARLILLASDAASNTCRRAAHFGEIGRSLWLTVPAAKGELGRAVGRAPCAMIAVTDIGFAASLVNTLAKSDPEKYDGAAEQLRIKAEKALLRQQEQRRHQQKLKKGARRATAAPPSSDRSDASDAPPASRRKKPRVPKKTS